MDTWLIILITVLVTLVILLGIVKQIMFPKELMKQIGNPTKYMERIKSGDIVQLKFEEFIRDYSKNKHMYILSKNYARVMNRAMKRNGKGTQLMPRLIHFTFLDKIKYLNWIKRMSKEGKINIKE